jgi:hypothetical protein
MSKYSHLSDEQLQEYLRQLREQYDRMRREWEREEPAPQKEEQPTEPPADRLPRRMAKAMAAFDALSDAEQIATLYGLWCATPSKCPYCGSRHISGGRGHWDCDDCGRGGSY